MHYKLEMTATQKTIALAISDFTPLNCQQGDLFTSPQCHQRSEALMQVIDRINHSYRGKIHFASRGTDTSE
ncbi:hypothetical protein C9E85_15475 [Plesiomonas shigelloides]|uniref:hypothetical protein n=1 Tax=Plesiomonas shigelloides TaxID=703 RepID=UPI000D568288|nr:hypothetical protein [Plesiomonas shigelloides]PVU64953.1 hypothetical protein C9E85_15475 [Plesiomonas shigelloides]